MREFNDEKKTHTFLLTASELIKATGGTMLFGSKNEGFLNVSIDSRNVSFSSLFVPLRGKNLDGHKFIEDAIKKGAIVVLVDSLYEKEEKARIKSLFESYPNTSFIVVEDNLKALQDASRFYLNKINLKLKIGITGSSGKTTVKEMIGSLFSEKYSTFVSQGNLNSETGLPLSIFMLKATHEVGVFEMGMNRKGEIKELADVLTPDVAIITNVGSAHIGMLGSREAIALEKKEIFSNFTQNSVGFVPECCFTNLLKDVKAGKMVIFGASHLKNFEGFTSLGLSGSVIKYAGDEIKLNLVGEHNVENAILTITVGEYFAFKKEEIKKALEKVRPSFGRAEVKKGFVTCFFDCYNANPESMNEAIDFCNSLAWSGKKIAILGSMLELGEKSVEEHKNICEKALHSNFDVLYFFGNEMLQGLESYLDEQNKSEGALESFFGKKVFVYKDKEFDSLKKAVASGIQRCDFVLLKASRGLALERLEDILL